MENLKIQNSNQFEFLYFCGKMGNVENCVEILHILSFVVMVFGQNLSFRIFILQFNFMVFFMVVMIFLRFINPKQSYYRLLLVMHQLISRAFIAQISRWEW